MKPYAAMIFDVGGTLLRLNLDALTHAYCAAALPLGHALDFARTRQVISALELELPVWQQTRAVSLEQNNGSAFWIDFYSEGFRRLGIGNDVCAAADQIRERFQRAEFEILHEDVIPTLAALTARGISLGILSNFSANLENVLRQVKVHHYFRFFIVSAVVGIEKPDPKIFDLAVRAAARERDQIVYIGDSIFHDIQGARNAGVDAILVDRQNRNADYAGARVQDLRELAR